MKFINAIQKGDFVKLRTASKIMPIIDPNLRLELGNVVRIKSVSDDRQNKRIYFHAENNGIEYQFLDGDDLFFDDRCVEAVMINGIWYDADSEICFD